MKSFSKLLAFVPILGVGFHCAHAQYCQPTPEDRDGDCIPDAIENQLLQRFAPILYPNEIHNVPQEGAGVPVSVTWLLRNSRIMQVSPEQVLLDRPSLTEALALVNASANGAAGRRIRNYYVWGDSPGDVRSWPISISLGEGVYGRVWKPWPITHPHVFSIQYFVLLTWNETAYDFDYGNHESDWLCVDYAIDVRCGFENPPIVHAIYHNHGPQIFVTPELLEMEGGHPVVYVEKGTNEAWPNRGTRGKDGWPRANGFATDKDWDDNDNPFLSEYGVHREHDGNGNRHATHDIPNIGDVSKGTPISLCGDEGLFLLLYQGHYGWEATPPPGEPNDPPQGPRWQGQMWTRTWLNSDSGPLGPWTHLREPFSPDTSGFRLYTTTVLNPPAPPFSYTFTVPQLLNPTYVNFSAASEGTGSPSQPYKNLLLGIAMTADNGTVIIQPGSFPQNFQINQAVTLTAPNGVVTIGQ